jgi:hypothetical protein
MSGPERQPKCIFRFEGRGAPCGRTEAWHVYSRPSNPIYFHAFESPADWEPQTKIPKKFKSEKKRRKKTMGTKNAVQLHLGAAALPVLGSCRDYSEGVLCDKPAMYVGVEYRSRWDPRSYYLCEEHYKQWKEDQFEG